MLKGDRAGLPYLYPRRESVVTDPVRKLFARIGSRSGGASDSFRTGFRPKQKAPV